MNPEAEVPAQLVDADGPIPPSPAQEPTLDAVVVIRTPTEDGGYKTDITTTGDVRITEVETLMKLGLRGWLDKIGLS
jgi:hypothetical protein